RRRKRDADARIRQPGAHDHGAGFAPCGSHGGTRRGFGRPPIMRAVLGRVRSLAPLASAVLIAGCGGNGQSTLNPKSKPAHDVTTLWWWMLAVASIVFFGAIFMLTTAWLRRKRTGLPFLGQRERLANLLVIVFGICIPVVVLAGVFLIA